MRRCLGDVPPAPNGGGRPPPTRSSTGGFLASRGVRRVSF